ncbi:MAG: MATE family efflux transporter, partial [Gemmatimonadetes bacterium]|nr:MATE family efflux transporter [Gemmatimonadota bacterium]
GRWLMLGILWWFGRDKLAPTLRPWHRESVRLQPLVRMAAIGAPVAFQQWLEVAVFAAGAVAIGWISVTALAAHEIAINLAALTFMVPLGLSAAAAAMVGRAVGRGDLAAARRDAVAAIGVGVLFMAAAGALFLFSPEPLAALFVSDPAAREITVSLIMIAGVFQVFDGIQCVSAGVLRGAADTRVPMLLHLGGFWGIGAPLSLWLAFGAGLGPQGIWWGYVGSLGAVAVAQLLRVRWRLSRDVARLRIEDTHEHAAP